MTNPRIVKDLGDLYRNSFVREFALMSEEEFENSLDGTFLINYDPKEGGKVEHKFTKDDFVELTNSPDGDDPTHLFKLASRDAIKKLEDQGININSEKNIVKLSCEY